MASESEETAGLEGVGRRPAIPIPKKGIGARMSDREKIRTMMDGESPLRWVFTGDSITHGALHTYGWRDYTELFSERLRYELGRRRDMVIKSGISGWTIYRIAEDLEWNVLQFSPHVVSVKVGTNDCVREDGDVGSFRDTYSGVIDEIRSRCASALILHTPNDSLVTDGKDRAKKLGPYVAVIRELAAEKNALLVDHYALWHDSEKAGSVHHWIGHGCHPNEYGHRILARQLFLELGLWDDKSETCRLFIPGLG